MESPVQIDSLDHLVLTVRDLRATLRFYEDILGMRPVVFGDGRHALHFGAQKLNLHQAARPVDPNVRHATPGSADFCLLTSTPLPAVAAHLAASGVKVILGPVRRTGARGPIESLYFHDPDENLVEVASLLSP
jgi:catechol 2,3-dioxygenase-like lactoylglutathione lyase family enzyme